MEETVKVKEVNLEPLTEIKEEDEIKVASVKLPLPPGTYAMTDDFRKMLSSLTAEKAKQMDDETHEHISNLVSATRLYYPTDLYKDIPYNNLVNNMKYAGRYIGIEPTPINTKKPLGSKEGVMRFLSIAKQTETVDVALYHSGFRVTLQAPTLLSIVQLIRKITDSVIRAGRDTNTIAFSNYSAVTDTIISDFILQHLQSTTLNLSDAPDKSVFDFISGNDYPSLVLGLLRSQYPKGTVVTRYCKNAIIMDEDNKFKCDFSGSARVDLNTIFYKDDRYITDEMLLQLSKVGTGVISIEEALNYQSLLEGKMSATKSIEFDDGTDNTLTIKLSVPTINKRSSAGERWIQKLVKKAEELFTVDDDTLGKNDKVNSILTTVIGGVYSSVITELIITNGNGESQTISGENNIDNILNELSRDMSLTRKIIDVCYDFIDNSTITVIGFPVFECPKCKELNNGKTTMPEIVPFNIVEYFFALSSLNTQYLAERI